MSDVKYNQEKLEKESQEFMDSFRSRMKDICNETLGELYVNIMPYQDTDTYVNYREALRIELEHEYKYSNFRDKWAKNFRRAVFVENREEISDLISKDIIEKNKELEDRHQDYEMFRYSPKSVTYTDLKAKAQTLSMALKGLSKRSFKGFHCFCSEQEGFHTSACENARQALEEWRRK